MIQRRNIYLYKCINSVSCIQVLQKKKKNPIFVRDARHVLPWRRTVSNVRRGIYPEIVVSMETVTQADYSIQEKNIIE